MDVLQWLSRMIVTTKLNDQTKQYFKACWFIDVLPLLFIPDKLELLFLINDG